MKPNTKLITMIRTSGIPQYRIAMKLNVHENTLGRMLRKELSTQETERIIEVLEELKKERIQEFTVQNLG